MNNTEIAYMVTHSQYKWQIVLPIVINVYLEYFKYNEYIDIIQFAKNIIWNMSNMKIYVIEVS